VDKDELLELAGNPEFISGIYNYRDRWCGEAAEVVRWYQFFIAAKVFRALTGSPESREEPPDEDDPFGADLFDTHGVGDDEELDYDPVIAKAGQMDANGSAKVALIAMDR
jgi:hypothetical protein